MLIADCEDVENLSASEFDAKRLKHHVVSQEGTLSFACEDGALKVFGLPQPHGGERPAVGILEQDDQEEEEETPSKKRTENTLGA